MVKGLLASQAHNCNYLIIITRYLYIISASPQKVSSISVNTLQLDDTTVPLSDTVKSLGILLNSTLFVENFIGQPAKSCYYQLRRISSVR